MSIRNIISELIEFVERYNKMKIMEQYIANSYDRANLRIYGKVIKWKGYSIHGAFVNTGVKSIQFHLRNMRFNRLDRYAIFANYSLMRIV